jgi:hypothetical protein
MCARCNNARSQPFDRAWDTFTSYLVTTEAEILRTRSLDLRTPFGESWREGAHNVARYLVKHLVCRIVDELPWPMAIDRDLLRFLGGGAYPAPLALDFCVDRGVLEMLRYTSSRRCPEDPEAASAGFLGLTALWVRKDASTGAWYEPQGGMQYRWLGIYWLVGGTHGDPFQGPKRKLRDVEEWFGSETRELFAVLATVPPAGRERVPMRGILA